MRYLAPETIEKEALNLLSAANADRLPVSLDTIADHLKLDLEEIELGDEVSGVLVVAEDKGAIGYNSGHSLTRQRFTIAHEIGHYILHRDDQELFIDKSYAAVFKRDQTSAAGTDFREIQANRFAAALLMPANRVLEQFATLDFDLGDEEALMELAERFGVSSQAMSIRLAGLGLFEEVHE